MQCYKVFVPWEEGRTRPVKEGTYERNGESKSEPRRGKYGVEGVEEVEAPLALQ